MATLCSIATGNASASGTWETCSSVAENDSEAATATVPTSTGGTSDSSTFVLAAGDYDAVAVKINNRSASPTGTISVILRNSTTSTDVKTVTVNVSDLPNIQSLQGGWLVFKFGSNYTANGTDSFLIRVTTSSSSMVTLYSSSANNWARQVRSTTTAAPAATDKMIVAGEYLSAGSSNSYTVTWDITATTSFGARTANATAIAICSKGTLSVGTSASTTYYMKLGGNIWLYPDATLNMATNGTNMPSTSSFVLELDCVSNVDYGIEVRSGTTVATWNLYGNAISNVSAKLAADASAGATSLTTNISTGWKIGDEVGIAVTTRTNTQCEKRSLVTADASGTSIPNLSSGLTNAHVSTNDANGDIRAELINLTRNIKIRGISTSLQGYINIAGATAVVTWRYGEFYNLGSVTASKRGLDIATTTGTFDCQYCAMHDCTVASSKMFNISATSGSGITISNNVTYNIASTHLANSGASSGSWTVSNNIFMLNIDAGQNLVALNDVGGTFTNNTCVGATNAGCALLESNVIGTFSGNIFHGNAGNGLQLISLTGGTISSCTIYRNGTNGMQLGGVINLTVSSCTFFGNGSLGGFVIGANSLGISETILDNCTFNAGATLTQASGINIGSNYGAFVTVTNSSFGATTAHTQDIAVGGSQPVILNLYNTVLASSTEVSGQSSLSSSSYITSSKHDGNTGAFKCWKKYGTISRDTTIYDVAPASEKMQPNNASNKLESSPIVISLDSGENATVTVKVRKSSSGDGAAYTGANQRLVLKKNVAAGITADVVLATASAGTGAAETLTGNIGPSGTAGTTTTDDAGLQLVVDCDGTAGWINVDTATINVQNDDGTMQYWMDGIPVPGISAIVVGPLIGPGRLVRS